eukprot:Nk52_evm17s164 gene=Nk52_evmTU17s164
MEPRKITTGFKPMFDIQERNLMQLTSEEVDMLNSTNTRNTNRPYQSNSPTPNAESLPRRSSLVCRTGNSTRKRRLLVTFAPFVNHRNESKLRKAVISEELSEVMKVLRDGTDVNASDEKGRTALHLAATKKSTQIVEVLVTFGANVNCKDKNGNTPLHLASCTSNTQIVTLLLKSGCDVKQMDNKGRTPLTYAESRLKLLKNMQIDSPDRTRDFKSAVYDISVMLCEYMNRIGDRETKANIESIQSRIHSSQPGNEVDELLSQFTSLSVQKEETPLSKSL